MVLSECHPFFMKTKEIKRNLMLTGEKIIIFFVIFNYIEIRNRMTTDSTIENPIFNTVDELREYLEHRDTKDSIF